MLKDFLVFMYLLSYTCSTVDVLLLLLPEAAVEVKKKKSLKETLAEKEKTSEEKNVTKVGSDDTLTHCHNGVSLALQETLIRCSRYSDYGLRFILLNCIYVIRMIYIFMSI